LAREKCRHQKFQQLQLTIISTFTVVNMQWLRQKFQHVTLWFHQRQLPQSQRLSANTVREQNNSEIAASCLTIPRITELETDTSCALFRKNAHQA
jgi:hypothetical protein